MNSLNRKNIFNNKLQLITKQIMSNRIQMIKKKMNLLYIRNYINQKIYQKNINLYNPSLNNKKLLLLIATNTDTEFKMKNIMNTLNFFNFDNITKVVVNSYGLPFNNIMSNYYYNNNIKYYEIQNDVTYDFGKWIFLLSKVDYTDYDFIFFINDSIIIQKPINHFINLTIKNNVEIFGYNDSTQSRYHYQSYFFAIKSDVIQKFIYLFESKKNLIKNQNDVICNYELNMTDYFSTKNCFLNIGNIHFNKGLNIFFTNDMLYEILKKTNLLPFIKIKRLIK